MRRWRRVFTANARKARAVEETMALQRLHLPSVEEQCAYLAGLTSATEYRVLEEVSPLEHERLLELGWRHFGAQYFRPVCAACRECVSLRVPVATFRPTKSQRRAWKKCADLGVIMGEPVADAERLELFQAWHAMREESRGWSPAPMTAEEYRLSFCQPHPCAREFAYYDGERLVAVGLVDVTPNAVSSAYFYYHPDCRRRALGVASVLFEIFWARENGRAHLYLGYRVRGCPSTVYKAQYGPHELLAGRPEFNEAAVWVKAPPE
jgi:leucyl-tRNA---protein transferase